MKANKSEELDKVLSELPGMEQSEAVENAEFIRFTVRLRIDLEQDRQRPEIFLLFTQDEFSQAKGEPGKLESLFKKKIERSSFKDALNGQLVGTSVQQGRTGVWTALTVDGSIWEFNSGLHRWVKAPIEI